MKKIGIICAMAVELQGILDFLQDKENFEFAGTAFTKGYTENAEVVATVCGVGKVNAAMCTQIMIDIFKPDVIINSGVAGSVSPLLSIGDTVVATAVVQHDMNTGAFGDPQGLLSLGNDTIIEIPCDNKVVASLVDASEKCGCKVIKGIIASGDIFVDRIEQRKKIADRFNALACEMEGGAVGHVCYRNKVPFCVFRAISDDLNQNESVDFQAFCKIASEKSINTVKTFISQE